MVVAGVVEALFTVGIIAFISRVSPGSLYTGAKERLRPVYGLLLGMVVLTPVGLLAAGTAWGEWGTDAISTVASAGKPLGFIPEGMQHGFSLRAWMPDYSVFGIPETVGYILSAVAGVAVLLIVFKVIGSIRKEVA